MGLWNSLDGRIQVRITSASIENTLQAIISKGITLDNIETVDELTVVFTVSRREYKLLHTLIQRRNDNIEQIKNTGIFWTLKAMRHRFILVAGMLIYVLLVSILPTRILFVEVQGNSSLPKEIIVTQAENCGIKFGASRRDVRSERVKNALLSALPQLQWVGVTTKGCVASISVRERTEETKITQTCGIQSIVSKCDAVVLRVIANKGNVLCKPGQAVKAGQILISGYTDCGISIKATAAQGEVYGLTRHQLNLITPEVKVVRKDVLHEKTYFSLLIGKKLIKLYKDSGISDTCCVKISSVTYLQLPGGFRLPIALISERVTAYDSEQAIIPKEHALELCREQSASYLKNIMVAGRILHTQPCAVGEDDHLTYSCNFSCIEMIGQTHNEEIITTDE